MNSLTNIIGLFGYYNYNTSNSVNFFLLVIISYFLYYCSLTYAPTARTIFDLLTASQATFELSFSKLSTHIALIYESLIFYPDDLLLNYLNKTKCSLPVKYVEPAIKIFISAIFQSVPPFM